MYKILTEKMSNIMIANLASKTSVIYGFSAFKKKISKIQDTYYDNIKTFYNDLNKFEEALPHLQKLKYKKHIINFKKQISKIKKRQMKSNLNNQQSKQTLGTLLLQPFVPSTTYQLFYNIQNEYYKPIDQRMILNKISLEQLYQIVVNEQKSMFSCNLQPIIQTILSNPSVNPTLYQLIKTRSHYLQEQLCINVFNDYQKIVKMAQQSINNQDHNALNRLRATQKKQAIFTQDFKFNLNPNISPTQNLQASQIGKQLTKYNFASKKTQTFALKSLSNEGYKSLTPASLSNHLFILGYNKVQIREMNDHLYRIFDVLCAHDRGEYREFWGQLGPMNSMLFYILANKIEIYQLLRSIMLKICQNYKQYISKTSYKQKQYKEKRKIQTFDLELFCLMLKILKSKYQLTFQSFQKELSLTNEQLNQISIESLSKNLLRIQSDAYQDFEQYLNQKLYKYERYDKLCDQGQLDSIHKIIQDKVYKIEQKKFICLNLPRIDKNSQKQNGVGQLILEYFKINGQPLKIINPIVINKCQKWGEKQAYFKSKLKGLAEPVQKRERRFDF